MTRPGTLPTLAGFLLFLSGTASADLWLGPAQILQSGGVNIAVPGYSVPSWQDWNADGLNDLLVGQGGGTALEGKVRVYLNGGTVGAPVFSDFFYVQAGAADLTLTASGCLGVFPRVVYWDADARKDLLAGEANGKVRLYTNVATDEAPAFDTGVYLQVGPPGGRVDIAVGARATPVAVDWNSDGRKDLLVGALDGRLRLYLNVGTDTGPDFQTVQVIQNSGTDLLVATGRSSPCVRDLDGDGDKDLVTGDTEGRLWIYPNVGTDASPAFAGCVQVEADGVLIDLPAQPRSRPFLCYWAGSEDIDVLIGSGDGLVRLYEGQGSSGVETIGVPMVRLLAPYPNPTTGVQTYPVELARAGSVDAAIVDVSGRIVSRLLAGALSAGTHPLRWDSRDESGRPVAGGVYYLRLDCGGIRETRAVVVLRRDSVR